MRKRITRISPWQLGKVLAVLYAIFSIPIALVMGVAASFQPPGRSLPWAMIVAIPIFYVVFGFLFSALGAWLYNLVAKWTGGVEYEAQEMPDA